MPVSGMHIDCGDGELRQIKEVYWSTEKPNEVGIYFEEEERALLLSYWIAGGWTTKDFKATP